MAGKNTVTLEFAGDEKKLTKAMDHIGNASKDLEGKVGRTSSDMARKSGQASNFMQGAFKIAAGSMIASFSQQAIGQVTNFLGGMVSEAREAEKVSRSTAQGIKTIGAESWTSADAIGNLAEKISNKIGVDDELIQQSANLLLTFKNIKNAVGENNNVFDRAVLAAQDLAAKGFGDADSAAKMLGKALNDPIKGITALGKAGVTFSEAQKEQIAKMVESGDLLGAQKIIMGELEAQVGGTAEATVSAGDKMATTWANFQEDLGTAVLPMLDDLLTLLTDFLTWASEHEGIVIALAAITAGIWLLNAAMNANPIILVMTLIALLVVGLITLWEKSAGFRDFWIGLWDGIKGVVGGVVNWIVNAWNGVISFFQGIPQKIGNALSAIGGFFERAFKGAANLAIDAVNWMISRINDLIAGINHINPFSDIPPIPKLSRMHTGGVVPGPLGSEQMMILQAGERVIPRGQAGNQGGGGVTFNGDLDSKLATLFMKMIRDGDIVLEGAK